MSIFPLSICTNTAHGIKTGIACSVLRALLSETEAQVYILEGARAGEMFPAGLIYHFTRRFPTQILSRGGGGQRQEVVGCVYFPPDETLSFSLFAHPALASIWTHIHRVFLWNC